MNPPHTPTECLDVVFRRIDTLTRLGLCTICAFKLAASEYDIAYDRVAVFYLERIAKDE